MQLRGSEGLEVREIINIFLAKKNKKPYY